MKESQHLKTDPNLIEESVQLESSVPHKGKTFSSKIDADMKQKYLKKLRSETFDINGIEQSLKSKMEPPEAALENLSKIMATRRFSAESTKVQKLFVATYEIAQGMESKIKKC
jgi:hypothetical protein